MLATRNVSSPLYLPCQLRLLIASHLHPVPLSSLYRISTWSATSHPTLRRPITHPPHYIPFQRIPFSTSLICRDDHTLTPEPSLIEPNLLLPSTADLEHAARTARNRFGETLPENHLSKEEYDVYERLYGAPIRIISVEEQSKIDDEIVARLEKVGSGVLFRQGKDGALEEVVDVEGESTTMALETAWLDEAEEALPVSEQQPIPKAFTATQPDQLSLRFDDEPPTDETFDEEDASGILTSTTPIPRTHPLTKAGRFTTYPSTIQLPPSTFTDPITTLLSHHPLKHLTERAHTHLGGPGLPYSPSTPRISRTMEQRPISIRATQTGMREGEADTFIAAVMPQIYASTISVLVETRKRLGGEWLRGMAKEGGPAVLDVGGGGAAVLAWKDVMRAELGISSGRATVVTGSETLRYRASRLLENTTFIPRLPEPVGQGSQPARKRYDVIIASHLLWPIKEDYMRKATVQTLWSLLNPDGGILILLEKGVPRGFEVVAGARQLLLEKHVVSPGFEASLEDVKGVEKVEKETGMIVAPCTNHARCPLYRIAGVSKGRKDWCYFSQRYFRPDFLQNILGAKSRNYDDVEFSYLSVMRGRDHRLREFDPRGKGFEQGKVATERAAGGYGPKLQQDVEEGDDLEVVQGHGGLEASIDTDEAETNTDEQDPHPLSLPRTILPPIKRKGHVLIDVCTPSGTLERWVVNRKCGKQAFRDARKAQWGDLWALGAKSRTERRVKLGRSEEEEKLANKRARKPRGGRRGAVETLDDEDLES